MASDRNKGPYLLVSNPEEVEELGAADDLFKEELQDFRKLLPTWAYEDVVAEFADTLAKQKSRGDRLVPMRCAVGPAVPLARGAAVFAILSQVVLFVLARLNTTCFGATAKYPFWLWGPVLAFILVRMRFEWRALKYSMIPYVQVVGPHTSPSGHEISHGLWCAMYFFISFLNLCDMATDSFFAATSLKSCECDRTLSELWETYAAQTIFGKYDDQHFLNLQFFIWLSWFLTFLQILYPFICTLPACGEQAEYEVGHDSYTAPAEVQAGGFVHKHDFNNIGYEKVNNGDALHTLAEASGMGTLAYQGLQFPKVKQMKLINMGFEESNKKQRQQVLGVLVGRHLGFAVNSLRRGITRIGLVGLLENSIQIHLQITMFALDLSVAYHFRQAVQAGVSIALSITMSLLKLHEGWQVFSFARKVREEVLRLWESSNHWDERKLESNATAYNNMLRLMVVLLIVEVMCAVSLLYAAAKLAGVFYCEDGLLSLNGCIEMRELGRNHTDAL